MTTTCRMTVAGDTYRWRRHLKEHGWNWDRTSDCWARLLTGDEAQRAAADDAYARSFRGHVQGCRVCLDGTEIWRSRTYIAPCDAPSRGDEYNSDQYGNYVRAAKIPGSSPDDRI